MRSLANYALDLGWQVSGSDLQTSTPEIQSLRARGAAIFTGHDAAHVPPHCHSLIYSAAVPAENPERRRGAELGLREQSYPQFLGELSQTRRALCVAGTHGKSTTTGLLAWILRHCGRQPDVLCGAEVLNTGRGGWAGGGREIVLESCEFRRHFLQLQPHAVVLTGIEWDHVDCFGSLAETVDAFTALLRRVPESGLVVYRRDCRTTHRAMSAARLLGRAAGPQVVSFGLDEQSDWRITSQTRIPWGQRIELTGPQDEPILLTSQLPGRHNLLNNTAAAVLALELGVEPGAVAAAVASFAGMRRRLQPLGDWRGMTLLDDYAHHPTAVRAVIETLRAEFPSRRLRIVFQPHQLQRTDTFAAEFIDALATADAVHLLPVYAAREAEAARGLAYAEQLASRLQSRGIAASVIPTLDHVWETLETEGRPGDVVVVMGAGSIERIADESTVRLRRNHAG